MVLLRIDPRMAPLWRDDHTIQFGVVPALTISRPLPWQERAIAELERGFPSSEPASLAAAVDAPIDGIAALLDTLRSVIVTTESGSRGVIVRASDRVAPAVVERLITALDDSGCPAVWAAPDQEPIATETPTILLGAHLVPPHMADRCMREAAPHLPITFRPELAVVGPLVIPGESACLACVAAHDAERDAAWPIIATQLLTREPPAVTLPLAVEAAVLAVRLLSEHPGTRGAVAATAPRSTDGSADRRDGATRSVRVTTRVAAADTVRDWRMHRPHQSCLCRGPADATPSEAPSGERLEGDRSPRVA